MSSWSAGYVTDVNYIAGYYPEQSPEFIRFAQLLGGVMPTALGEPNARYCELGFGLGLGLNVLAAVHPEMEFWGTDFSTDQLLLARDLGAGICDNLTLFDDSFEQFAARETPPFDFIALHGIWSWVSPANQRAILQILREKLKPGGAVYVSYNAQPGWSLLSPLREILHHHARLASPAGNAATAKVQDALAFVAQLEANKALFIAGSAAMQSRLKQVREAPLEYVAHEYLNEHHQPLYFSQVAEAMESARLDYVASSKMLHMIDTINLSQAAIAHVAQIQNRTLRQVVRDFYMLTTFRQDVFVRGARRLREAEQQRLFDDVRLHLTMTPDKVPMKITGALGESNLHENIYRPLLERLAQADSSGLRMAELRSVGPLKALPPAAALEATCFLMALGALYPVVDVAERDPQPAHRLNERLLDHAVTRPDAARFLASPTTLNAHAIDLPHALFMSAHKQGVSDAKALARHAWDGLQKVGQRMLKDGQPVLAAEENLAMLEGLARDFVRTGTAVMKRLQVA